MYIERIELTGRNFQDDPIPNFEVTIMTFEPNDKEKDKEILAEIEEEAKELAEKVNPAAANNSAKSRDDERILNNCIAGLLAEYCWKKELNNKKPNSTKSTECNSAATQIDLITNEGKKIEVRSSFPRNGIEFALFHPEYQFDVLGPYSNSVKPGEIQKDFYVRTLYPIDVNQVTMEEYINNDEVNVYLTGGATWDMMTDRNIYENKHLIPDDEIIIDRLQTRSQYRVIPFGRALDTKEIINEILKK